MSYGVEAPILLCSDCVAWDACLAGVLRICFFPRLTIWVTSLGFCAAEFAPPHPRFYPMFPGVTKWSAFAQPSRSRSGVHNSGAIGTVQILCCRILAVGRIGSEGGRRTRTEILGRSQHPRFPESGERSHGRIAAPHTGSRRIGAAEGLAGPIALSIRDDCSSDALAQVQATEDIARERHSRHDA